jgi:glycosyltransferase involved in cell wall biosynthesis
MKLGIMLRHLDQHGGGVRGYTEHLLREFFAIGRTHEFVLMYQNPDLLGTYGHLENVTEVAVPMRSKFLWDQVAVPRIEKEQGIDIIFNPKYSLPLRARCPAVFVCHGLDWYVMPWGSRWIDRISHRLLIPRYARKAAAIIAVSETARKHVVQYLEVSDERTATVYLGLDEIFRNEMSAKQTESIRRQYELPEKFFLYVGQIYPAKNFGRILRAYARVGPKLGIHLVVAGSPSYLYKKELSLIESLGLESWVKQVGWIEHDELPAFYSLAEALLLPSLYEACPSPPIEAMATGCPVLTADRYGTKEIAGEAALFVNPEDIGSIADGMSRIVSDNELRSELIDAGYERAKHFQWRDCARQTLYVLERVAAGEDIRILEGTKQRI